MRRIPERVHRFLALNREERRLFLEAWLRLGLMRAAIRIGSLKRLTTSLDQHAARSDPLPPLPPAKRRLAVQISRAVIRAAAHTPWESACLAQALAAQRMLRRRNIPGALYLGIIKGDATRPMRAHAWVRCGDLFITGAEGHRAFTVLSVFSWNGELHS